METHGRSLRAQMSWHRRGPLRRVCSLGALAAFAAGSASACIEVIAHRGASGYLPEHTLPAYALGYGQGAHWIEPDVVLTADGVPIALHDLTLDRTTNVADVYPGRAREDGKHYAADFAYAEIQALRVVEAVPGRFPYATFRVPRLAEVLELVQGLNRTTGRRVGIYPELKWPASQPNLAAKVLRTLEGADVPVYIQSFDAEVLAALETEWPRVQLMAGSSPVADATLDTTASYAVAIGVHKDLLLSDPSLTSRAQQRGLSVHVFTLRSDHVAVPFASFEAEVAALLALGVDAMFTDHPDRTLAVLGDRACASGHR